MSVKNRYTKYHGGRALLNSVGLQSTAAIVAEIENSSTWKNNGDNQYNYTPDTTLQIANCDRSISFEFDWYTPRGRRNNIKKVDTLIKYLQLFREGLVTETAAYEERAKTLISD